MFEYRAVDAAVSRMRRCRMLDDWCSPCSSSLSDESFNPSIWLELAMAAETSKLAAGGALLTIDLVGYSRWRADGGAALVRELGSPPTFAVSGRRVTKTMVTSRRGSDRKMSVLPTITAASATGRRYVTGVLEKGRALHIRVDRRSL